MFSLKFIRFYKTFEIFFEKNFGRTDKYQKLEKIELLFFWSFLKIWSQINFHVV